MKRFWLAVLGLALTLLLVFLVFQRIGLEEALASPLRDANGAAAALLGVGLLVADVVLPVPSSVVMVLHGALFGVGLGALLSTAGGTAATLAALALGRAGRDRFRRFVTPAEHDRASALLARYGLAALIVTRPVPILAETFAIVAGASGVGFGRGAVAGLLGTLPAAFFYARAGVLGAQFFGN